MRLSSLAAEAGLPTATVKYYLRLGLLPAGTAINATESSYGDVHRERLRLIRALRDVVGLPLDRIARVLEAIDHPSPTLYETLGRAVGALDGHEAGPGDHPRARAALAHLGMPYEPGFPAVAQLDRALAAAESVGLPVDLERLERYAEHLRALAAFDLARMPIPDADEPPDTWPAAVRYAVLGTALHEPVLVALRRLTHQELAVGLTS